MFHTCFKHITLVSKRNEPNTKSISNHHYCQIMAKEVYDGIKPPQPCLQPMCSFGIYVRLKFKSNVSP
jgi:hypothetical protein